MALHGMDDRDQGVGLDLLHQLRRDAGRGGIGPHAAGVGALIVVEGPFVILGRGQRDDRPARDQGLHAQLVAVEPFLDDDLPAGPAEFLADHDPFDGGQGFLAGVANHDPLALQPGRPP